MCYYVLVDGDEVFRTFDYLEASDKADEEEDLNLYANVEIIDRLVEREGLEIPYWKRPVYNAYGKIVDNGEDN